MFQYNTHAIPGRGGSKPFLGGFQPPKTILTIRPVLLPQESFSFSRVLSLVNLNKVILSPRHLNAVLTRCDRAFLRAQTDSLLRQQVNTIQLSC